MIHDRLRFPLKTIISNYSFLRSHRIRSIRCVSQSFSKETFSTAATLGPSNYDHSRLGIGGSKLSQNSNPEYYPSVISTALLNGVTTFESGLGGEGNLSKAYQEAMSRLTGSNLLHPLQNVEKTFTELTSQSVLLTARFGYRTQSSKDERDSTNEEHFPNDIPVEIGSSKSSSGLGDSVMHNISKEFLNQCILSSPLVKLRSDYPHASLLFMVHNPEAQAASLAKQGASLDQMRDWNKERLTDSFIGLEKSVSDGFITSYGVCSNGLSLPSNHPLHLSWQTVLHAASNAVKHVHGTDSAKTNLSTLQLPANVLETQGLQVARDVKTYLSSENVMPHLNSSINIFITRPLTSYPDFGTGSGYAYKLVDYQLPTNYDDANSPMIWTHNINASTPPSYIPVLNSIMSHFDATHILEASDKEGRNLSVEERETVDGCRLLQSMIHDLNSNLSSGTLRSFVAYEDELYNKVVPLLHGTFEELDEESAAVLEKFFLAHGGAVRHSIARSTRKLLKEGGNGIVSYQIPDDQTLQEFALQFLLKQKWDLVEKYLVDKVIVGCPRPEHVLEAVQAIDKL